MEARSLRLADLLAGLSLVTDLGFGLPREHAMRSCVIATTLARNMGLPEDEVADAYYTALLEHVGCMGYAHETALTFGDELVMSAAGSRANPAEPRDLLGTFLGAVTRGRRPLERARIAAFMLARGSRFIADASLAVCEGRVPRRRATRPAGRRAAEPP